MAWKIVFTFGDRSEIKISNNKKRLTKELAEKYQKIYARPNNDGGKVYVSPFKTSEPVALQDYINKKGE